eukprot:gene28934-3107_t
MEKVKYIGKKTNGMSVTIKDHQNWKMDKFTDASALTHAKYEGKISITIDKAWSTLSCIPSSWPSGSANAKCNKDTTKAPTTTITRTTITTITSVTSTSATTATETTVTATSATSTTMTSRTTTSATTTTVRVCSAGEFLEASTNDCMACPDGTFQPLDGHSSARCQRHATRCAFNEFVSSEPTATSNLICKTSEECGDGEFESKAPTSGKTERECTPITACQPGEYISRDSTSRRDQECAPCDTSSKALDRGCTSTTNTRTTTTRTTTTRTSTTITTWTSTTETATTSTSTTTITNTATTTTTTTTELDADALKQQGITAADVRDELTEKGISQSQQVEDLLAKGFELEELIVAGYTERNIKQGSD